MVRSPDWSNIGKSRKTKTSSLRIAIQVPPSCLFIQGNATAKDQFPEIPDETKMVAQHRAMIPTHPSVTRKRVLNVDKRCRLIVF
jgi:hypothetical protein